MGLSVYTVKPRQLNSNLNEHLNKTNAQLNQTVNVSESTEYLIVSVS